MPWTLFFCNFLRACPPLSSFLPSSLPFVLVNTNMTPPPLLEFKIMAPTPSPLGQRVGDWNEKYGRIANMSDNWRLFSAGAGWVCVCEDGRPEQKLKMAIGIFLGVLWSYKRHLQMSGMWTQSKCYWVLCSLIGYSWSPRCLHVL